MDRKRRMGRAGYGWRERRRFPRREGTHPRATSLTRIVADRVRRCKESRSPRLSEQSFPRIECRRRTSSLTTSTQSSPTREDATMSCVHEPIDVFPGVRAGLAYRLVCTVREADGVQVLAPKAFKVIRGVVDVYV